MTWAPAAAGVAVLDDVLGFLQLPLAKADSSALTRRGFDALVRALVTAMQQRASAPLNAAVRAATARLDRDWGRLTDEQRERAIAEAAATMQAAIVRAATVLAAPIGHAAHGAIEATRQATARAHQLSIPEVFSAADARAAEFARTSAGFFIRSTGGRILAGATDQTARSVIERALREGWDHRETGAEMERALAGTIAARSGAYFEMVASVAISRARSYSQLKAFEDAGFTTFQFQSVLDEVTSDICRFMHGRTFEVRQALGRHEEVSQGAPGDVVDLQPFARLGRRADGSRVLFVESAGKRTEIADVVRSAVGRQNETGVFRASVSDARLQAIGCCTPPLHPHCRSTLLPVSSRVVSAPAGTSQTPIASPAPVIAPPAAPAPPPTAPAVPRPLEEGVHFLRLRSSVSKAQTAEFLERAGFEWVRDFLAQNPLGELKLQKSMSGANGFYLPTRSPVLAMNMGRGDDTFGRTFEAGKVWSISSTAATREEATLRTFVHELAHHIHVFDAGTRTYSQLDALIGGVYYTGPDHITEYAQKNRKEYFAESFAAYVFERAALQAHDRSAFDMVEAVLKRRGITIP